MTNQEAFDKAVAGLASQGFERSSDESGSCLYRGPEGRRCAIGWLINDEQAERLGGAAIVSCVGIEVCHEIGLMPHFAYNLQLVHDYALSPENMRDRLSRLGIASGLALPEVLR